MFTRSPTGEPKKLEPLKSNSGPSLNAVPQQPQQRRAAPSEPGAKSVIGNDLKIIGQGLKIISQGTLQVDGEVEGDVGGSEVIIGEKGKVTGTVAAERVIVRGQISGVIRGVTVTLQSSSRVEGDIHHMSLAIEGVRRPLPSPGGCVRAQPQSRDRQAQLSRRVRQAGCKSGPGGNQACRLAAPARLDPGQPGPHVLRCGTPRSHRKGPLMHSPVEIHFHGIEKSEAIEERVREKVSKLEKHFSRMTHCRVVLEAPHAARKNPRSSRSRSRSACRAGSRSWCATSARAATPTRSCRSRFATRSRQRCARWMTSAPR